VNVLGEEGDSELSFSWTAHVINQTDSANFEKLLDIGCGVGTYLSLVKHYWTTTAVYGTEIDIDKYDQIITERKIQPSQIRFGDPKDHFEQESFDVITMFDVIEHIPDPIEYLAINVYPLLKPGGIFIFQTPNKLPNSIKETIEWKSLTKWKIDHCSLQTRRTMKEMLDYIGFKEIVLSNFKFDSQFKRGQLHQLIPFAPIEILIKIINVLPNFIYPNIWGYAIKRKKS
jgi:2-polyprenyl-3-methyl-5-hydroxy-6-metoxy-1,4-benzoquinol methylase